MGECTLSVSVITPALLLLASSIAFNVRREYLGKLIPIITSSLPIRTICYNSSLELLVCISRTLSNMRFR